MAIAALSVDPRRRPPRRGARARWEWRCGSPSATRSCSPLAPGCSCWSAGPSRSVVERGGEMLGGALLIVLGAIALWGLGSGRVYGHSHRHGHEPRAHWHLHVGRRDHHPTPTSHSHLPDDDRRGVRRQQPACAGHAGAFGNRLGARPLTLLLSLILVLPRGFCCRCRSSASRSPASSPRACVQRIGAGAGALVGLRRWSSAWTG